MSFRVKRQPLTVAQELMLIGQHSELGMAFVNEFMPLGPANYTHTEQQACLERIRECLREKQHWAVVDGKAVRRELV